MPHFTHWSATLSGSDAGGKAVGDACMAAIIGATTTKERHVHRILALLFAVASSAVVAADPPPPWSGEVSAGLIVTTGNSETTTANAKAQVVYQSERWRNTT